MKVYKHRSLTWSIVVCISAQGSCFCKRHFTLRRQVGSQKSKGTIYRIVKEKNMTILVLCEDSNTLGHSWGFKPHHSQHRYKTFLQQSRKTNFWLNVCEDSNFTLCNNGIKCSTSWAENKLWVVLFFNEYTHNVCEMIISGGLLWGFTSQIYRCCYQILYLLTFFKVVPQKQKRWVKDYEASNLRP